MDAEISLALAVKLRKIFEKKDRFLTFPIGLGYTYKSLAFMEDSAGLTPQEQLNFKGNFARQFNFIPDDSVRYMPDPGRLLWNDIRDVVSSAEFAESALSPKEEQKLDAARKYLQADVSFDGESAIGYSRALAEYYQYRKNYNEAHEAYLNEKLSVEFASGLGSEDLIDAWNAGREAELKAEAERAEQDWITLGHRFEVEDKLHTISTLSPRKYLESYRQDYMSDIDVCELADLNGEGVGFYSTFFSPLDAFKKSLPWPEISLTREELKNLVAEAPPDLKTLMGGDKINDKIESISLEYNNVVIMRPWFHPEFFSARHWKLSTDNLVSNGGIPRSGRIPAYVTSMLAVRNITVLKQQSAGMKTNKLAIFAHVPVHKLKVAKPTIRMGTRLRVMPATLPKPVRMSATLRPRINPALHRKLTSASPTARLTPTAASAVRLKPKFVTARFKGTTVTSLKPMRSHLAMNALFWKKDKPTLVTETYNLEGISILALVCKRVPKCPDPDPNLRW